RRPPMRRPTSARALRARDVRAPPRHAVAKTTDRTSGDRIAGRPARARAVWKLAEVFEAGDLVADEPLGDVDHRPAHAGPEPRDDLVDNAVDGLVGEIGDGPALS